MEEGNVLEPCKKYLHSDGHNLWDPVYLRKDPIHDTSIQLEGNVALEGHNFANELWSFVAKEESSVMGWLVDKLPDSSFVPTMTRVTISAWPKEAPTFAPTYKEELVVVKTQDKSDSNTVPNFALGRYGNIVEKGRSSDKALIAMFDAAQTSIRFLLQDLGPVNRTVAGKKVSYRGWPKEYMKAMGRAMWERGVDIEIVLSHPFQIKPLYHEWPVGRCEKGPSCISRRIDDGFFRPQIGKHLAGLVETLSVIF
jgi:hypothetical protein